MASSTCKFQVKKIICHQSLLIWHLIFILKLFFFTSYDDTGGLRVESHVEPVSRATDPGSVKVTSFIGGRDSLRYIAIPVMFVAVGLHWFEGGLHLKTHFHRRYLFNTNTCTNVGAISVKGPYTTKLQNYERHC